MVRIIKMADTAFDSSDFGENYGWAATVQELDESEMLERQAEKERTKSCRKRERAGMNSEQNYLAEYDDYCAKFKGYRRSQRTGRRK